MLHIKLKQGAALKIISIAQKCRCSKRAIMREISRLTAVSILWYHFTSKVKRVSSAIRRRTRHYQTDLHQFIPLSDTNSEY